MKCPVVKSRTVLITGCSSGIGEASAHYLRDRGWTVYPTARKQADITRLCEAGFDAVALDVASSDSIGSAVADVLECSGGSLGAVVNNAGFGQPGAIEDISRDALRYQFEVNVFGAHELTNALLPTFRTQGYGRIVNISSVLGRVTIPMVGSYCAAKHAMESLSDALRIELRGTGIGVSLVEPGPILSAFRKNAVQMGEQALEGGTSRFEAAYRKEHERRRRQIKKADLFTRPPEAVAARILHAISSPRPRRRYCVTIPAYLGAFLRRAAPDAVLDAIGGRRMPRS